MALNFSFGQEIPVPPSTAVQPRQPQSVWSGLIVILTYNVIETATDHLLGDLRQAMPPP
jgi:hypothetical protein